MDGHEDMPAILVDVEGLVEELATMNHDRCRQIPGHVIEVCQRAAQALILLSGQGKP